MPTHKLISSGSAFEAKIGYSRAVVSGAMVFVSGCTGYDYATGAISPDVAEQAEQTMRNIASALEQAGAKVEDVVRAGLLEEEMKIEIEVTAKKEGAVKEEEKTLL
ncbi:hypothetical protein N0V88_005011 [Collariella sp. IMI 366227]|nr:hypothetical protein N0V88_005011 [Collariella sp. IMI 366227]